MDDGNGNESGGRSPDDVAGLLRGYWQDLLKLPDFSDDDHFFDLGGSSLMAVRLSARLSEATGRDIPLQSLFADPTFASQVERLTTILLTPDGEGGPSVYEEGEL